MPTCFFDVGYSNGKLCRSKRHFLIINAPLTVPKAGIPVSIRGTGALCSSYDFLACFAFITKSLANKSRLGFEGCCFFPSNLLSFEEFLLCLTVRNYRMADGKLSFAFDLVRPQETFLAAVAIVTQEVIKDCPDVNVFEGARRL